MRAQSRHVVPLFLICGAASSRLPSQTITRILSRSPLARPAAGFCWKAEAERLARCENQSAQIFGVARVTCLDARDRAEASSERLSMKARPLSSTVRSSMSLVRAESR